MPTPSATSLWLDRGSRGGIKTNLMESPSKESNLRFATNHRFELNLIQGFYGPLCCVTPEGGKKKGVGRGLKLSFAYKFSVCWFVICCINTFKVFFCDMSIWPEGFINILPRSSMSSCVSPIHNNNMSQFVKGC